MTPIQLPRVDDLCEIANQVLKSHGDVWFFKADHKDAYRQVPLRPADAPAAVITLKNPQSGHVFGFVPKTLVFGSASAVLGYNLVARAAQSLFVRFFKIPLICYFDDFAGAGSSEEESRLVLACFNRMNALLGPKDEPRKRKGGSRNLVFGNHSKGARRGHFPGPSRG